MGLSRLKLGALALATTFGLFCALPANAQSGFPVPNNIATPTTVFSNDVVITGNIWNCMGFSEGIVNQNPFTPQATWFNAAGIVFPLSANVSSVTTGAVTTPAVTIYANSLFYVGDALRIRIQGHAAATANTKTVTFNWGSTNITLLNAAANNNDLYADIHIIKTGTNTQQINVAGYSNAALFNNLSTTSAQVDSANINVGVTLGTATANNDFVLTGFTVYAEP